MLSEAQDEVTIETIDYVFALNATLNNNSNSAGATTEMFLNLATTLKRLYFKTPKQQQNVNLTLKKILTTLLCGVGASNN